MKKVKKILLVDDSSATNFFNKVMIQKTGYVEEVLVAQNGKEALDYIQSEILPEVIFLDINMPVMDGWEFLSAYERLSSEFKKSVIVLMIGAELAYTDKMKAENIPEIVKFSPKHLTKDLIIEVIETFLCEENSCSLRS